MPPKRRPVIDRILEKVSYDQGCWIYNGYRLKGGYGMIGSPGGNGTSGALTHRAVYEATVGPIPVGHDLDHLCRNRSCCSPLHLEPVTRAENVARGRGNTGRCRFTPDDIEEMKLLVASGNTQDAVAASFGVTRVMISRLVRGHAGASVTGVANDKPTLPRQELRTHCPAGHPYEGENLIRQGNRRMCRECRNARQNARYRERKKSTA